MTKRTPVQERIYRQAQEYYPMLWSIERLNVLAAAGKLLADDYKSITGKAYTAGKEEEA